MKDLNDVPEFLKYFRVINPSEIAINKDDIFYRDKYNDIINYIKSMLTNHEKNGLKDYLEPNGAILINVNPGTDILDYLKLITKNYYLDLIEFNVNEIIEAPNKFLESFISILEAIGNLSLKENELEDNKNKNDKINEKKVLLINQQRIFKQKFEEKNLLEVFLNTCQYKNLNFKFINLDLILVWVNYDIQDIISVSDKLYTTFDLFIKIPLLNKIERETVLRDFLERHPKIVFDINDVVNYTENWEVQDINHLLKVGIYKHFLNSELNETSNEITDSLIDLIVSGEYIPNIEVKSQEEKVKKESNESLKESNLFSTQLVGNGSERMDINDIINEIQESRISDFMLNQLYENAASKNYNELIVIIDKLNKNEPLEDNDRKLLAKYPFVLNDTPNKAQINLEKAKKRIDLIKQVFGK